MRLLDTYAISCGAKINQPYILDSYFPLPFDKFITFQAQSKFESKDYDYWQDVINIITPILLNNDIKILQVGIPKEFPYQRVIDLRGQTSIHQLAYLIKRSKLHFGPDSFGIHLASAYDIPIVGLYSATSVEVAGPHFGSVEKQALFSGYQRLGNGKPSYQAQEKQKSINTLKPEEIANAILKLLNINFRIPFNTVFVGERYSPRVIREIIPNSPMILPNPEAPVEIRADLYQDDSLLPYFFSNFKMCVVITNRRINLNLLKNFKQSIASIVYKIEENDDPKFIEEIVSLGIPIILISELPKEILSKKKIKYYEYGKINPTIQPNQEIIEKLKLDIDNLYYRSIKLIASNGKMYSSHAHLDGEIEMQNDHEYVKVIDTPKFWNDLDFYTIVKKINYE